MIENIKPDYVFREGDILFVAGGKDGLRRFLEWVETLHEQKNIFKRHIAEKSFWPPKGALVGFGAIMP